MAARATPLDLATGMPHPSQLPMKQFLGTSLQHLATEERGRNAAEVHEFTNSVMQYGPSEGSLAFRTALADFLTRVYQQPVCPETLFATNGASQGLFLVMQTLSRQRSEQFRRSGGDGSSAEPPLRIGVEEPTYWFAMDTLRQVPNSVIVPVAINTPAEGVTGTTALDAALPLDALYVIPTGQNPTGGTMTNAAREVLVAHAMQHKYVLVADDVYEGLTFPAEATQAPGQPPADPVVASAGVTPLVCIADRLSPAATEESTGDNTAPDSAPVATRPLYQNFSVVSLGSFSKMLFPGMRCGWLQFPRAQVPHVLQPFVFDGPVLSGGGYSHFTSECVRFGLGNPTGPSDSNKETLCSSSWISRHVGEVRRDNAERCKTVCDALEKHIADRAAATPPSAVKVSLWARPVAGYFIWLVVQGLGTDDVALAARAKNAGVLVKPGSMFSNAPPMETPSDSCCLRLCFAYADKDTLAESVERLFAAFDAPTPTQP